MRTSIITFLICLVTSFCNGAGLSVSTTNGVSYNQTLINPNSSGGNILTTNSFPLHLGTNTLIDGSTNVTYLDAINSSISNSPNSVFGWLFNATITNSQGLVVGYARGMTGNGTGSFTNNPTFKNSDHLIVPYVISSTFSNWAGSALLYSRGSIHANTLYNADPRIYGLADFNALMLNDSFMFYGSIGGGEASQNFAVSFAYMLNSESKSNTVGFLGLSYGSFFDFNTDSAVVAMDGAFVVNNANTFVGLAHADIDDNLADIENNDSLSILSVPAASTEHNADIINVTNALIFGNATMVGGQVRITENSDGSRSVKQYGDTFGASGVTDFTFSQSGILASGINYNSNPHTPVAVTLGASPFNFTNRTSVALECFFSSGTAYSVSKHNSAVYGSLIGDGYFILQPTNYCTVTYTVAPTFFTNALF